MFIREVVTGKRSGSPVRYLQIVESYRDADTGKSRHRVLLPLGRADRLDRARLRSLVVALERYAPGDAAPAGFTVGKVQDLGVPWVCQRLWERLGLPGLFQRQLRRRRFEASVERAVLCMVAQRMNEPGSKLACWDWVQQDARLEGCEGLQLQHFYRALDFLAEFREELEKGLYGHRKTLFDEVRLVLFDTTSTWFECDDGEEDDDEAWGLRQYGYSRDERGDRRQVVIGLAVDQMGLPLLSEVFSGDTTDSRTVVPMLSRLREMGLRRVVWVTDRGMTSDFNLSSVRAAKLGYVVGTRLRSDEGLRAAIQADTAPLGLKIRCWQAKELRQNGRRLVVCFNEDAARRDLRARTRALDRLKVAMERVERGAAATRITGNPWFNGLCTQCSDGVFRLDKAKLDREAQCDGTWVLEVEDDKMTAEEAIEAYQGLLGVESAFRTLKHGVDVRPVYHRLDERIQAHVAVCMLALLLERVAERATGGTFAAARKVLRKVHAVEVRSGQTALWQVGGVTSEARELMKKLKIAELPKVLI